MAKQYTGDKLDNGLFYTDSDILKMYNEASDKREQLKILAQLNLCKVDDIKQALIRAGLSKLDNGLYYTDKELLDMYNKNMGDKRKYLNEMAQMNSCSDEEIKKALLRAGLDKRKLPRKRKTDVVENATNTPIASSEKVVDVTQSTETQTTVSTETLADVFDTEPVETATQTRLLQVIQNSIITYQDILTSKKTEIETQIQDLESQLVELRKQLHVCNEELAISKSIFH